MESSFFIYIQRLELIGFFSGYPLIYLFVNVLKGKPGIGTSLPLNQLLPKAYALVGSLYLGLQLRHLYPDYTFSHIQSSIEQPYWTIWAILALLFWLPVFCNKPILSFVHSLPFFFLLCRDMYFHTINMQQDNNVVRNDMKVYSDSLLLQLGSFTLIALFYFFKNRIKKKQGSTPT